MNKLQYAEQFRKALQMFAQTLTNDDAMQIATIYDPWNANVEYKYNELIVYGENEVGDPQLYRCIQEHKSQSDWPPDIAISLWDAIGLAPDSVPIWSRPTGAHDAYNMGDRVHYPTASDSIYISRIDGNVYSPDEYPQGWEVE